MVEYLPSKQAAAGSSPVFRSIRTIMKKRKWRHGQVVRQEPAKLLPPVRIWVPPNFKRPQKRSFLVFKNRYQTNMSEPVGCVYTHQKLSNSLFFFSNRVSKYKDAIYCTNTLSNWQQSLPSRHH